MSITEREAELETVEARRRSPLKTVLSHTGQVSWNKFVPKKGNQDRVCGTP